MSKTLTFNAFMAKQIAILEETGKKRTSETYRTALNRLNEFLDGSTITFSEIDVNFIDSFEESMLSRHICRNTTSFYMRILRAVYNRGVERGWTRQRDPFRHVYTGVDKTQKRAVSVSVIRELKTMDLSAEPKLAKARDLFLFSFYTRGMSFIDMAYLRQSDLWGEVLRYTRRKTGRSLSIHWEPEMQEIIDRYPPNLCGFLLPILTDPDRDLRQQYKNAILNTNQSLAVLSDRLNLPVHLTTYVARHSWASIAYSKNVPLSLISEGMGHESEKTTRIYLASLPSSGLDKANRRILKML